jgi:GNAT superfamily N-acetyltransferase
MSLFEKCSAWVAHLHPSNQPDDTQGPSEQVERDGKTPCLECPTTKQFVDQREWFSEPTITITTEHEIKDQSANQKYTSTIYTKLTKVQFEILAQQIEAIHSSEKPTDVAHFYALASGVLNNMDPSSIVIMATISVDENTNVPIGYAYISGTPASTDQLRQIGVMVIPEYRKKGIAFQLFRDLLGHAAEFGITKVQVDFRTDNKPIWTFLSKAAHPDRNLINFTREIYGSETVATIEILSPTINP